MPPTVRLASKGSPRFVSATQRCAFIWGKYLFSNAPLYAPLQAADLLAWESRKQLIQKIGGFDSTPRWKELFDVEGLSNLSTGLEYAEKFWTAKDLEENLVKI